MSTAFTGHEGRWQARLGKLRDVVRQELVRRQLAAELAPPPVRIIDLGCGQGTQAVALARRGYEVTGVDASAELLARFERDLAAEPAEVRARVQVEHRLIEDWAERSGVSPAEAVLCHGVLMYAADPGPLLRAVAGPTVPRGCRPAPRDRTAPWLGWGYAAHGAREVRGVVAEELWPGLLAEAWTALGGGWLRPALQVTGAPGRLPSHLPVEDTAIACAGAALLAASALQAQRGRTEPPAARLDRGHVAAVFRSEGRVQLNGQAVGAGFAPLSRFWRASDGWVRTHGNYPWHRDALLHALGCGGDREAVAAAIAGLGAREVEDLVTGAGGVAAAVRTEAGWRAGPAGQAVAAARLIEGGSLGDAPPRRRAAGTLPAAGIRVLDLTRVIAGPVATRYLAALGADVLRLDPPHRPELPQQTYDGLLGKRSALLDLGTGSARLHELLDAADVLVHGYRPRALDRFGLSADALAERHPGLVVVSLSAWGRTGPWGGRRGFDSIVQAASGIAVAESADGDRPGAMPCQLLDHGTGYLCAAAVLCALAVQAASGGTQVRELSLARTAHWLLGQGRAGAPAAAAAPEAGADDWLTTLASAEGTVTVVRPPGQLDGQELAWPSWLTRYGSDPPAFA